MLAGIARKTPEELPDVLAMLDRANGGNLSESTAEEIIATFDELAAQDETEVLPSLTVPAEHGEHVDWIIAECEELLPRLKVLRARLVEVETAERTITATLQAHGVDVDRAHQTAGDLNRGLAAWEAVNALHEIIDVEVPEVPDLS